MSPGATMMRVYETLKARIIHGVFPPGVRLDPSRLAQALNASQTPVREALHRLAGERLVESWDQDGFRQPEPGEPALRDLYNWSRDVSLAVVRAASAANMPGDKGMVEPASDYAGRLSLCLRRLARRSPNREHWAAVASIDDRLMLARPVEYLLLPDAMAEIDSIEAATDASAWSALRRDLERFHIRRLRAVPGVAAALRRAGRGEA